MSLLFVHVGSGPDHLRVVFLGVLLGRGLAGLNVLCVPRADAGVY